MRMSRARATAVITLVLLVVPAAALAQTWQVFADRVRDQELTIRPTVEGRQKLYLPSSSGTDDAYVLFRGDRLFPLRAPERVRIVSASPKDDHIEIEIRSDRLGQGRLDFFGPAPTPEITEQWLDEVFELRTPEMEFFRYIGHRESHVVHLRGANHLPSVELRQPFPDVDHATGDGYRLCGVCFVPTPDVSDYATEQALAMMSLQQVRSSYYPFVEVGAQERVATLGGEILERWPVPLKGYRYRFQIVDSDDVNAFAVPTGYVFVTRGLLDAVETDEELSAVLAHEIAHVESRHTYRIWRNAQRASAVLGVLSALSGSSNNVVDDVVTQMSTFVAGLFLSGFGREREREADLFASLYFQTTGRNDTPLRQTFLKLKFARDAVDPFRSGGDGLFASHPNIDERLTRASGTVTVPFRDAGAFYGLSRSGALVATLRLDAQRLHQRDYEVVATLTSTAELGQRDSVNTLTLVTEAGRVRLDESTAESIFPSDEVSAVFRATRNTLIEGAVTRVELRLRNVDRWVPATEVEAQR